MTLLIETVKYDVPVDIERDCTKWAITILQETINESNLQVYLNGDCYSETWAEELAENALDNLIYDNGLHFQDYVYDNILETLAYNINDYIIYIGENWNKSEISLDTFLANLPDFFIISLTG